MSSIAQVSETMQTILSSRAKALERESGFVERSSAQLDGPTLSQTTVLTWMHTADASYTQLRHTAASLGVHVSNQAIEQRFSAASARLLRALLEEAVEQVISSEASAPEVLARFNGVYLQDGTVISLPTSLAHEWPGHGQVGQEAALRVQGRSELGSGCLSGLWLQAGSEAERSGPAINTPLPVGSLFNADMGYFTPDRRCANATNSRQYWLTQAKATLTVIDQAGQCCWLLRCADERRGGCGGLRGQARALSGAADRGARLGRGSQAAPRGGQWAYHPSACKVCQAPIPGKRKPKGAATGQARRAKSVSAARLRLADWTIMLTNAPQTLSSRCRRHSCCSTAVGKSNCCGSCGNSTASSIPGAVTSRSVS